MNTKRSVFISGASSGIGEACAMILAKQGCDLVLTARRIEKLEELRSRIMVQFPVNVYVRSMDVANNIEVEKTVEETKSFFPNGIDILINNAGLAKGLDHLSEVQDQDLDAMIDTNLKGVVYLTRAFLRQMKKKESLSDIVMINSIAGRATYEGGSIYTASKHALRALTKTLRLEVVGLPIRVISIDPGMVETEFSLVRFQNDAQKAKNVYKGMTPLTARDVAECVEFAVMRPPHVNIDEILVLPRDQAAVQKVNRNNNS